MAERIDPDAYFKLREILTEVLWGHVGDPEFDMPGILWQDVDDIAQEIVERVESSDLLVSRKLLT